MRSFMMYVFICCLSLQTSVALGKVCSDLVLKTEAREEKLFEKFSLVEREYVDMGTDYFDTHNWAAANIYQEFSGEVPFPLKSGLVDLLMDFNQSFYHNELLSVLTKVKKLRSTEAFEVRLKRVLNENLRAKGLSRAEITERIKGLESGSEPAWRRALGELSLKETQMMTYGEDPLNPAPNSLIGRYLQETGAASQVLKLKRSPKGSSEAGVERLYVNVDRRTFRKFKALFFSPHNLFHIHTPHQGTLLLGHNGWAGTYGNLTQDFRSPRAGTIMPMILLSSSEGGRALNYFEGRMKTSISNEPWTYEGYCSKQGGYDSCTHWFGNIPVGDRKVSAYTFPGYVDDHASNRLYQDGDPRDKLPRVSNLRKFRTEDEYTQRVWQAPGYEQLSHVIGLKKANDRGELANPGYVALKLTGEVNNKRVPVVFVMVGDAKRPLKPNWQPQISAY